MILRPGQRIAMLPGHGMTVTQGRATLHAGGASPCQPYLLDHANYPTLYNADRASGREFSLSDALACYGIRVKCQSATTVQFDLWRVSDEANLATNTGAVVAGENLLYFAAPVTLVAGTLYRVSSYPIGGTRTAMVTTVGADHPDGAIVTLTANSFCYRAGNAYPNSTAATWASSVEPIICS